jgi:hypothetical protein
MKTLNIEHKLFKSLRTNPPLWWNNLKADPELYIDIRKDNYINVYHNGGSIMKLEGADEYKAKIHFEYIPFQREKDYLSFIFENDNIIIGKLEAISLDKFSEKTLRKIKDRIKKSYPNDSEKGLQGTYVVRNKKFKGFFIDTEFEYKFENDTIRIDIIWVDIQKKKIAFVELKTMGNACLFKNREEKDSIEKQLSKYYDFITKNSEDLKIYYEKVFRIKKELGILPEFVSEETLSEYKIIEKPILLIGDCTQIWIDNIAKVINKKIEKIAFACIYQGITSFNFRIPEKSSRNIYKFD